MSARHNVCRALHAPLACGPKVYDVQGHPSMVVQQPVVSACSHWPLDHSCHDFACWNWGGAAGVGAGVGCGGWTAFPLRGSAAGVRTPATRPFVPVLAGPDGRGGAVRKRPRLPRCRTSTGYRPNRPWSAGRIRRAEQATAACGFAGADGAGEPGPDRAKACLPGDTHWQLPSTSKWWRSG